jgi:hypothetical protein
MRADISRSPTPAEAAVVRPPRSLVVKRGLPVAGPLAVG